LAQTQARLRHHLWHRRYPRRLQMEFRSVANARPSQCSMAPSLAGSDQGSVGAPALGNYNLTGSASKKQQKAQKTSMFYRELTDALHSKVADFMVGVDELDDSEDIKHEISKLIDGLSHKIQEESDARQSDQVRIEARCEKLENHITAIVGNLDNIEIARVQAENEARNRHAALKDNVEREMNQALQEHHTQILREMQRQIDHAGRRFEEMAAHLEQLAHQAMDGGPKVQKMQEQLQACDQRCATLDGHCIESLQRCQTHQDRLHALDGRFDEEVGALMNHNGAMRSELNKLSDRNDTMERHRDVVQECFDTMEQKQQRLSSAVKELAKNATAELQATRDELDQINSVIGYVSKAWGAERRLRNARSPRRSARGQSEEPTSPGAATGGVPRLSMGYVPYGA